MDNFAVVVSVLIIYLYSFGMSFLFVCIFVDTEKYVCNESKYLGIMHLVACCCFIWSAVSLWRILS